LHERKRVKRREAERDAIARGKNKVQAPASGAPGPNHEVMLLGTFVAHFAATIHAEDSKERRQEIGEALEAYEGALDGALYEILDNRFAEEESLDVCVGHHEPLSDDAAVLE
jgi:hypothetical protein